MFLKRFLLLLLFKVLFCYANKLSTGCRDRSSTLRQDGGLCFEIPPWQHQPVALDQHITDLRSRWTVPDTGRRTKTKTKLALVSSEVTRYLDTVISPFLDTYHRDIQSSYQQFTTKLLKRIKDEIFNAVRKKNEIYKNLTKLADDLHLPTMCDEERRAIKTLASRHVARIYSCTENTRDAIAKMGKYSDEMITITKNHMLNSLDNVTNSIEACRQEKRKEKPNVQLCLKTLSRAAVSLGYELDLSLTNARRFNEQSCERLTLCCNKAKKMIEEFRGTLSDHLYQCVYA